MSSETKRTFLPVLVLILGGFTGFWLSQYAWAAVFVMTCTVASQSLTLNNYDPLPAAGSPVPVTAPTGTITVSCVHDNNKSVTVDYSVKIDTTTTRQLKNPNNDTINYELYTDSTTTTKWGTTGTCVAGDPTNKGNLICGSFSVATGTTATKDTKNYYAKAPDSAPTDVPIGTYTSPALGLTLTYACNPAPTGKGTC
jgi:spore coat protein U-like protein